jgi:hypothetical protein
MPTAVNGADPAPTGIARPARPFVSPQLHGLIAEPGATFRHAAVRRAVLACGMRVGSMVRRHVGDARRRPERWACAPRGSAERRCSGVLCRGRRAVAGEPAVPHLLRRTAGRTALPSLLLGDAARESRHGGAGVRIRARGQSSACRDGPRARCLRPSFCARAGGRDLCQPGRRCFAGRASAARSLCPPCRLCATGTGATAACAVAGGRRCGGRAACRQAVMAQHIRARSRLAARAAGRTAEILHLRTIPDG